MYDAAMSSLSGVIAASGRGAVSTFERQFRWGMLVVCVVIAIACVALALKTKKRRGSRAWLMAIPATLALLVAAYLVFPRAREPATTSSQAATPAPPVPDADRDAAPAPDQDRARARKRRAIATQRQALDSRIAALRSELRVEIQQANLGTWNQLTGAAPAQPRAQAIATRVEQLATRIAQRDALGKPNQPPSPTPEMLAILYRDLRKKIVVEQPETPGK